MDLGNGTCQEPAKQVFAPAPTIIPALCPPGTTDNGNGTCQEPAKQVIGSAPIVIPQPCPAGTMDLGNGTCQEPAKQVFAPAPTIIPALCPAQLEQQTSVTERAKNQLNRSWVQLRLLSRSLVLQGQ